MAPVTPLPNWKDRLKACFSWRHRALHVFGVPAAAGAAAAVATSAMLTPDAGPGLGMLVAAVGTALYGYFVTSGFDKKLNQQLIDEAKEQGVQSEFQELQNAVYNAEPALRPVLERILYYYNNIESVYADGASDTVEAVLESSRDDIKGLRDRALGLVNLHRRLSAVIAQSDAGYLKQELNRMEREMARTGEGPVRDALVAAHESTERTLKQWTQALEKQHQIRSVLTVIESNLQEFKLAMELRKADAAMGANQGHNVGELQQRLIAAGRACDELVGRTSIMGERRSRRISTY
ncbi:MAG: hypothetical protein AB7S68_21930 [Polyangiaceae bacterium]